MRPSNGLVGKDDEGTEAHTSGLGDEVKALIAVLCGGDENPLLPA